MKYIITLSLVFSFALFTTASKAQMRLMAKAHRMYSTAGNILEDSVRYFHSGVKGASAGKYKIPEFELMEDSMHVFTKSGNGVKWTGRRVSTYNGTDFNESIYYTWSDTANNWRNNRRTRIIYAGGKPDTVYSDSWSGQGGGNWSPSARIKYTWNGNNIATQTRQTRHWAGAGTGWVWRNRERLTYTWSGNNETDYILANWDTTGGGSWANSTRRTTTYNGGKINDVKTFIWNGSAWADETRSAYAYDGSSRLSTIKRDIFALNVWEANRIDTFLYVPSNSNYPDTMIRVTHSQGSYNNEGKFCYKYLYDGRQTEALNMSWDGINTYKQTNNQDSIDNWYYDWAVNVEKVEAASNVINIYPSPANNTIHITLDGIVQDKHIQFAIMDMQGRLVKNWSEYSKAQTSTSVNELPAGNYILFVEDGTFKSVRKFTVSR